MNLKQYLLKFISHSNFLQFLASNLILSLPNFLSHNLSKYNLISNIFYTLNMDNIIGDYNEFGCFTGSSIKHAKRSYEKLFKDKKKKMNFYGFDSFEGFPEEIHDHYKNKNFIVDYDHIKKIGKKYNIEFIKGFFDKSLTSEEIKNKISRISFCFIDCDLGVSARPVFEFVKERLINGSFIMIDDYYNVDQNGNSIMKEFLKNFEVNQNVFVYKRFGVSGICYRFFRQ
jgi:hypothetical protein